MIGSIGTYFEVMFFKLIHFKEILAENALSIYVVYYSFSFQYTKYYFYQYHERKVLFFLKNN